MTAMTIRHVPQELRDELVARAARSGMSLEQYVLWGLAMMVEDADPADDPGQDEWLDDVRAEARETGASPTEEMHADRR